jgi:hypothetical protein
MGRTPPTRIIRKVIFAPNHRDGPRTSTFVGIYNDIDGTFSTVLAGDADCWESGGVLLNEISEKVIFTPGCESNDVGIYNNADGSFTSVPTNLSR